MTRERAAELWPIIKAYGEGKTIEYKIDGNKWKDVDNPIDNGLLLEYEYGNDYRIKPEPKKRPMTRGEVLYMVTKTPGMVVRFPTDDDQIPYPAQNIEWNNMQMGHAEYAIIDESGEPIDGWHEFEKEVTE